MVTKYRTGGYIFLVDPVEVQKETDVSVWVEGNRHPKHSTYHNYFDTWDEAKQHLMDAATRKVDRCRQQLERAKDHLGKVKGLRKSEEAK